MSDVKTVPAAVAMLRVLEAWGVENVYGILAVLSIQL